MGDAFVLPPILLWPFAFQIKHRSTMHKKSVCFRKGRCPGFDDIVDLSGCPWISWVGMVHARQGRCHERIGKENLCFASLRDANKSNHLYMCSFEIPLRIEYSWQSIASMPQTHKHSTAGTLNWQAQNQTNEAWNLDCSRVQKTALLVFAESQSICREPFALTAMTVYQ